MSVQQIPVTARQFGQLEVAWFLCAYPGHRRLPVHRAHEWREALKVILGFVPEGDWSPIVSEGTSAVTEIQGGVMEKTGVELIAEERARQVAKEGWTPEHDDEHSDRELAQAAQAYIENAVYGVRGYWPWDESWWKPKDQVRDLVRAGALIAAEIDRLQREKAKQGTTVLHGQEPTP